MSDTLHDAAAPRDPEPSPPPSLDASAPAGPELAVAGAPPSAADRPAWSDRLGAIIEVLLCSSYPTQIAIAFILRLSGMEIAGSDGSLSLPFVVTLSLADTLLLIALMVAITRLHGERVSALWLGSRPLLGEISHGVALIPVVFVLVVLLLNSLRLIAPSLHNVTTNPLEALAADSALNAALFALVAIFAGGVREELQRAFLLRRFERYLGGATVGVIVLSVAFGIGHVVQGWDAVVTTGALGAFWAVVYLRRRSSVAPVVSHAGFNSLEIVRVAIMGV